MSIFTAAAWKKKKQHLPYDDDATMMERNPHQEAASGDSPAPHLDSLFIHT